MAKNAVTLPLSVIQDGKTWALFSFEYSTPDGRFSSYFYALSFEHASYILAEMRRTAGDIGQLVEVRNG
ncbi:hypothetical protein WG219_11260 [Ectopseudomonas mendocina]|uniref:Uncharacterized protein n=1 Tax=Ectopseudomonas mendocina TaxID=300 RepID=A0ABZ2RFE3_ECTME